MVLRKVTYGFDVKVPINLSVWVQKGPANHSTTFAALRSYASDAGRTIITTGHCKENSTTRVFGQDVGAESSSVALDRSHKTHARQRRANCDSVEEEGHWSSSKSLDRTRGQQIKDELVIIVRPYTNILGAHLSCCVLGLWTVWHFVRMECPANVRHVGHVSRTTIFFPACLNWCSIKEISLSFIALINSIREAPLSLFDGLDSCWAAAGWISDSSFKFSQLSEHPQYGRKFLRQRNVWQLDRYY